jgi:S-adenosylmethionine:tRNA ribosyltransferase-isomerase
MLLEEFNYPLPAELIAQRPLAERDASRMMVLDRAAGTYQDRTFRELPAILRPGDLLVFNNTKVFPARLLGRRHGTSAQPIGRHNPAAREFLTGEVELMLTRQVGEDEWEGSEAGSLRPATSAPPRA